MTLPEDVVRWVEKKFIKQDHPSAFALLSAAVEHQGVAANPRLIRCAALASRGNIQKLCYYVYLLRIDSRDVIVAGEYDVVERKLTRVRDLNQPIPSSD